MQTRHLPTLAARATAAPRSMSPAEYHRHCYMALHFLRTTMNTLQNFSGERLHAEAPSLVSLSAYCLDRRD